MKRQNRMERTNKVAPLMSTNNREVTKLLNTHPFSGQLIDGGQASQWLIKELAKTEQSIDFCSAFIRSEALHALFPKIRRRFEGRILARWQLGDFLAGASDLQSFLIAKELGFKFYIRQDFHGKVFSILDAGILVGSANATLSGFGMNRENNAEVCTLVAPVGSNEKFIDGLFDGAVEIDETLFAEISRAIQKIPQGINSYVSWPRDLMIKLNPPQSASRMLISECLVSVPESSDSGLWVISDEHDQLLLGLKVAQVQQQTLTAIFTTLKIYSWLIQTLQKADGTLFFGSATAALHESLLDDPAVTRFDVKIILQNLLTWCQCLPGCGIIVDRPRYSQRIKIAHPDKINTKS